MTTFLRSQLAYFLAYVATGWLALQIAVPAGIAVPLFPPAGIALTALLIHGWRAIPGIFIAAAAVEILAAQQFGIGPAAPLIVTLIAFGSTATKASSASSASLPRWPACSAPPSPRQPFT